MVECGRPTNSPRIRNGIPRSLTTDCHVRRASALATSSSMSCNLQTCYAVVNRLCSSWGLSLWCAHATRTERGDKMGDREAGQRLAKVLRVAMAQAGIETWTDLGLESGVSPTTVDNWIYGATTPRAHHLAKVAKRLHPHTSAGALERAYLGLPPEEPPLIEVLREMAPDLHELVVLLRAQADEAVLSAVRSSTARRRIRRLTRYTSRGYSRMMSSMNPLCPILPPCPGLRP